MNIQEFVTENNRKLKIRGFLVFPDHVDAKTPCLIVSNGFTAILQSALNSAMDLAARGIAVVLFDFCGGGTRSLSQGAFEDMTITTEIDDLQSVIAYIEKNYDFENLFLLGYSQGGFISALVAARRDDIKGLIMEYPALIIPDDAKAILGISGSVGEDCPAVKANVGKNYLEDAASYDQKRDLIPYKGPVLIMHGPNDRIVPLDYSRQAVQDYDNARLIVVPDEGHGFSFKAEQKAVKEMAQFIEQHKA